VASRGQAPLPGARAKPCRTQGAVVFKFFNSETVVSGSLPWAKSPLRHAAVTSHTTLAIPVLLVLTDAPIPSARRYS
jgi:hypothetical protein